MRQNVLNATDETNYAECWDKVKGRVAALRLLRTKVMNGSDVDRVAPMPDTYLTSLQPMHDSGASTCSSHGGQTAVNRSRDQKGREIG